MKWVTQLHFGLWSQHRWGVVTYALASHLSNRICRYSKAS